MNPIKAALDSKIGRKLRGVSVVDNASNPLSALNRQKRLSPPNRMNPQNRAMEKDLNAAFKSDKVKGTPLR